MLQAGGPDSRSKSFSVSKGGTFVLSTSSGDVTLKPWDKDEVFVRVDGIDPDEVDQLEMTQSGNTVNVRFRSRRNSWSDLRYEISLPMEFNVSLKTAGGDIEFTGPMAGKLKGTTAGGDIRLSDVKGEISFTTAGGDIRTGKIGGDAYLKTAGGDIEVLDAMGEVEVSTAGGDIKVGNVGKSLEARTSGGDIKIGDVGGEAEVSTSGGDISLGKVSGKARASTAGGDIELKSASGSVSAKTAGGDIKLSDITGSVEAKTAGGDIRAQIKPTGRGSSQLKTAGGEIVLEIPSNAKATIEAVIEIDERWSKRDRYEVRSDFKAESYDKEDDYIRAKYVLNGGGETIYLETVNSNITIRKGR
jgi:DUF4097 and DUF4098 domain-containing protein YvlB